jgi:fatty acid desaturase
MSPKKLAAVALGLKHPADVRQVGIIAVYMGLLAAMFFVPACRNLFVLAAACYFSFLNAVVIHNSMHKPPFRSRGVNAVWRWVLSFGNLYPASANVPSHNLVHHTFDDEGQPDWASPDHVRFRLNLLNLVHFPNVAGPNTFDGVSRWAKRKGRARFRAQYRNEMIFAFGLTGALMLVDFWTALFFILIPQLYGARCILRINLIQHQGADTTTKWNHSRNFVGRAFNWIMCNNGYHTIHHNQPNVHWSELAEAHETQCTPRMDARLNEKSMVLYLVRTFLLGKLRAVVPVKGLGPASDEDGASGRREDRGDGAPVVT